MDHKEKNLKKPKKDGNPRDPTHLGAMVTNTKKIQEWDCKKNYHAIFTKHVNRNPPFSADATSGIARGIVSKIVPELLS